MQQKKLKSRIEEIIKDENIADKRIDIENLSSICLFFAHNKPYFNDHFSDFYITRNTFDQFRLTSPKLNNVAGGRNSLIQNFIISATEDSAYDDFDFFSEYDEYDSYDDENDENTLKQKHKENTYFLKGSQIKNLVSLYKEIKDAKNLSGLSKKLQNFANKNEKALMDFQMVFSNLSNNHRYPIYEWMCNNVALKGEFKHKMSDSNFRTLGQIKSVDQSNINKSNFKEEFTRFLSDYQKELKKVKNVKQLVLENKVGLSKVLNKVYKEFPELNSPVTQKNIDELDYYLVEIPVESIPRYKTPMEYKPNETKLKTDGFKTPDTSGKFVDFLMQSPYQLSESSTNQSNALEGLVYINDDSLYTNEYDHHFFIVAKTKKGETAGMLTLHQNKEYDHFCKIGEVSIKHNYRQKGLAKKLYNKMAKLAINNDLIITNRMYSEMGRLYLPKMKREVQKENPNFLLINGNVGSLYESGELNTAIEQYNYSVIQEGQMKDRAKTLNFNSFKEAYHEGLDEIKNQHQEPNFQYRKAKDEGLIKFNKKIEEKKTIKNRHKP